MKWNTTKEKLFNPLSRMNEMVILGETQSSPHLKFKSKEKQKNLPLFTDWAVWGLGATLECMPPHTHTHTQRVGNNNVVGMSKTKVPGFTWEWCCFQTFQRMLSIFTYPPTFPLYSHISGTSTRVWSCSEKGLRHGRYEWMFDVRKYQQR